MVERLKSLFCKIYFPRPAGEGARRAGEVAGGNTEGGES